VAAATGRNQPPATPFAELSVDEVQVYLPQQLADGVPQPSVLAQQSAVITFQEVEAELLPDQDEAALENLGHKLARVRGLRASTQSKFARALEAANRRLSIDQGYAEDMQPTMHMADACRLIWRQQLSQLLLTEAGVRYSSDTEYVHDMRVAVRRIRTALRLFGRYFRGKSIRHFRRTLRATGRRLGAVRDLDVALAKLATFQQDEKAGAQTDFSPVAAAWQSERDEAFAELLAWFDSDRYAKFLAKFARFCATPGKGAREFLCGPHEAPQPHQVRHVIPSMLMKQFERVRTFELLFEAGRPIPAETLHQLRIQCKFLRYNLEFAQPLLGPSGAHLIGALKKVQEELGDLNDAAVSQRMLSGISSHDSTQAVDEYYTAQAAAIEQVRDQVRGRLQEFVGLANRRRLAQVIARI
jgi:CHAD domain-containing protein